MGDARPDYSIAGLAQPEPVFIFRSSDSGAPCADLQGDPVPVHGPSGWVASRDDAPVAMDASLIMFGAEAPGAALALNRVALGVFFAITGYLKLSNESRHASLTGTLRDDGVPGLPVMQWLVPGVEFSGGVALILGLLSALAAFGLFVVCLFAVRLDGVKRIDRWQPINRLDRVADFLYLPEALYCVGLMVVMLGGPGPWSADAVLVASLVR